MDTIQWILKIPLTIAEWTESFVSSLFTPISLRLPFSLTNSILKLFGIDPVITFRIIDLVGIAGVGIALGFMIYSIIKT